MGAVALRLITTTAVGTPTTGSAMSRSTARWGPIAVTAGAAVRLQSGQAPVLDNPMCTRCTMVLQPMAMFAVYTEGQEIHGEIGSVQLDVQRLLVAQHHIVLSHVAWDSVLGLVPKAVVFTRHTMVSRLMAMCVATETPCGTVQWDAHCLQIVEHLIVLAHAVGKYAGAGLVRRTMVFTKLTMGRQLMGMYAAMETGIGTVLQTAQHLLAVQHHIVMPCVVTKVMALEPAPKALGSTRHMMVTRFTVMSVATATRIGTVQWDAQCPSGKQPHTAPWGRVAARVGVHGHPQDAHNLLTSTQIWIAMEMECSITFAQRQLMTVDGWYCLEKAVLQVGEVVIGQHLLVQAFHLSGVATDVWRKIS